MNTRRTPGGSSSSPSIEMSCSHVYRCVSCFTDNVYKTEFGLEAADECTNGFP